MTANIFQFYLFIPTNSDSSAMVIDLRLVRPQRVLVSVNEDLDKWYQEVEHQPVVHHLDAARLGEALADPNKHGGQH